MNNHSVEVRQVETDWSVMPGGVTYYFIGQPKTWKTSAAASWSDKGSSGVLVLDTDLGADFVDKANVVTVTGLRTPQRYVLDKEGNKKTSNSIDMVENVPNDERGYHYRTGPKKGETMAVYSFNEVYSWLLRDWEKLPYDTIVIDTIDKINGWVEELVIGELKITAMGEAEWGADWGRAKKRTVDIILKLQRFLKSKGANLIIISHSKTSTIQDGKVQLSPDLPKGLGNALTGLSEVIGYSTIIKGKEEAHISFESYDERSIGSRLRPLFQKVLKFDYETIKQELLTYEKEAK
jgi:hypothetical protein